MDETNKSSFDFSNLGGLLFGGDDSGLGEYLSPTQQKAMQNQALMSAAMSLLKNSGWTTQPVSLGQALGSAYEAGKTGYQGAQQNAIQQLLTKQKLDEARRAQSSLDAYQKFITGIPAEGQAITPEQAISAPGMAIGPTVERANLIGQPISGATMPSAGTPLTPQMQRLLSFLPPEKGIPEAIKMMQPQKTTGQPFRAADGKFYVMTETGGVVPAPVAPEAKPTGQPQEVMVDGKLAMVQYYEDGSYKVVSGVTPKIKTTGQPFKAADGKFYIQTETGDVIPAPVAPAPEITGEAFKGADGNYYYMTKQGAVPADITPAAEITGAAFKAADGKFYYPTKQGAVPADITPAAKPLGDIKEVTDASGQPVLVQRYDDGSIKSVEGFGVPRELVQVNLGGKIQFVDKNRIPANATYVTGMSPGEEARLKIDQENLQIALKRLKLSQEEFLRGQYDRVENEDGVFYVSKVPGLPVIPITGAGGVPLKGKATPKPTEGETNAAGFAGQMENAEAVISQLPAGSQPGAGSAIAGSVPFVGDVTKRFVQPAATQQYEQAAQAWIRAKLRKESGAAIGVDEMAKEYQTYFPQVGDSPAVIAQKARARRIATEAMKKSAGKSYTPTAMPSPVVSTPPVIQNLLNKYPPKAQ
jgi:hypothetical protein